jgi:hypothetical protein
MVDCGLRNWKTLPDAGFQMPIFLSNWTTGNRERETGCSSFIKLSALEASEALPLMRKLEEKAGKAEKWNSNAEK